MPNPRKFPLKRKIIQFNKIENARISEINTNWIPMATFYSSDFLRASFLTTSVFNRGIVTMLSNLIILKHSTIPPELPKEGHRYLEYRTSCSQGIYSVPMNEIFVGQSFADCCLMIYSSKNKNKLSGCLLIGVRTFGEGHKGQLLMNPLHYNIRNGDYAIVLAASEEIANFVTEFTEKVDMKNPLNWENIFRNRSRRKTNTKASVETQKALLYAKRREQEYQINSSLEHFKLYKDTMQGKMSGHIIIFGPLDLAEVSIKLLRERTMKPICYFSENHPNISWKKIVRHYKNLYYLEGDIYDIEHLERASISTCFHIIIYANTSEDSFVADSQTIMLVNTIEKLFKVPYTYEIIDEKKLRIIEESSNKKNFEQLPYNYWPHFMSGRVLFSSIIDEFPAILYKQDFMFEVLEKLLGSETHESVEELLTKAYDSDSIGIKQPIVQNKKIFSIAVPKAFYRKTFLSLTKEYLTAEVPAIPLGIVRNIQGEEGGYMGDEESISIIHEESDCSKKYDQDFFESEESVKEQDNEKSKIFGLNNLGVSLINPLSSYVISKGDIIILIGEPRSNIRLPLDQIGLENSSQEEEALAGILKRRFKLTEREAEDIVHTPSLINKEDTTVNELLDNLKIRLSGKDNLQDKIAMRSKVIKAMERTVEKMNSKLSRLGLSLKDIMMERDKKSKRSANSFPLKDMRYRSFRNSLNAGNNHKYSLFKRGQTFEGGQYPPLSPIKLKRG